MNYSDEEIDVQDQYLQSAVDYMYSEETSSLNRPQSEMLEFG